MCLSVEWESAKGICVLELVPWTVLYIVYSYALRVRAHRWVRDAAMGECPSRLQRCASGVGDLSES